MKFIFIQLGRIGDMMLATPAFDAIKSKYPGSELHVVTGRQNYAAIIDNPSVDKIIVFDKSSGKILKTFLALRSEEYDYHIDPKDHYSTESRIIANLTRANHKIGFNKPGNKTFETTIPGDNENTGFHYTQRIFRALSFAKIEMPPDPIPPKLYLSPDSENHTKEFIDRLPQKPIITINISASHERKMWDNHCWTELISYIDTEKYNMVLLYAPSEKSRAASLLSSNSKLCPFNSRSIRDAFSLIKVSSMLISPDTALVHAAAAFDVPLLGLFSGRDDFYSKFYPVLSRKSIVRAETGDWGIKSIKPKSVIDAYNEFFQKIHLND